MQYAVLIIMEELHYKFEQSRDVAGYTTPPMVAFVRLQSFVAVMT